MKKFLYKVYDINSTFLGVLDPQKIMSLPTFTEEINKGQGEMTITFVDDFDDFDMTLVAIMNLIKIYVVDEDNPLGRLLYTGFIEEVSPFVSGAKVGIEINLLGLVSLLEKSYYKSGSNYSVTHTSQDPADIFKAIVDHFNTIYPAGLISYSGGNVDTVGQTVTYTFEDNKWLDALKKIYEYTDTDWWWRINCDGQVYLKAKPVSATHVFTIGSDVKSLKIPNSAKQIVNDLQYRDGSTDHDYSDATSQTNYKKRSALISDSSTTDATTIDQYGAKYIAEKKDPVKRATATITSNYDIESVHVGDTCRFENVKIGANILNDNMSIKSVHYSPNEISIELEKNVNLETELSNFIKKTIS